MLRRLVETVTALTSAGAELLVAQQVEGAVDGPMRAVAQRILLHAEALAEDRPVASGLGRRAAVDVALGRDGREEAQRMLQRVRRGREAGGGKARGDDAGMRRASGVERLGHGAEVGDEAGALRGAERNRGGGLVGVEAAQRGAGRGRADGAEDARGVPALLVVLVGIAALQVGPHLVARDVGRRHLRAARLQRLALRQDGRHQHRARMAAQRHIVVVERVRGRAVDPGRLRRRHALAHQVEAGVSRRRRQRLQQDPRRVLDAAGDHGADAVGKAGMDHAQRVGGNGGKPQLARRTRRANG